MNSRINKSDIVNAQKLFTQKIGAIDFIVEPILDKIDFQIEQVIRTH